MFNGIITLLLGIVIYRHLLESALWVIGILVGMELIFNGWSWIMLALAVKKIPKELPAGVITVKVLKNRVFDLKGLL